MAQVDLKKSDPDGLLGLFSPAIALDRRVGVGSEIASTTMSDNRMVLDREPETGVLPQLAGLTSRVEHTSATPDAIKCLQLATGKLTLQRIAGRCMMFAQHDRVEGLQVASYGIKKIGEQRYREDPGRSYEDFVVGDVYEHWPGRTVTETDNVWFTNLTMNTHPVHFDANYASKTEFGKCLVNSTLTLALVAGMAVSGSSQKAVANLGWEEVKMPAPVFVGDTLYAETEVLGKRLSKSRPNQGIMRVRHIGRNQDGVVVIDMIRSFLVAQRGHATTDAFFARPQS